jgi:hypothetical protein
VVQIVVVEERRYGRFYSSLAIEIKKLINPVSAGRSSSAIFGKKERSQVEDHALDLQSCSNPRGGSVRIDRRSADPILTSHQVVQKAFFPK